MTKKQFNALMDYIDARIDEKIYDAFGRDSLTETIRANDARDDLRRELNPSE